jgi:predicted phage tail protein
MKTIRLYGDMGKRFGREYRFDVKSPAEAIRALCYQVEGFRAYLYENSESHYKIFVGGRNSSDEQIFDPSSDREIIRIAPVVQGAGSLGKIIAGAAMIYMAVQTGGMSLTATGAWAAGGTALAGYVAGQIGMSLIFSGVMGLLSSTPTKTDGPIERRPENKPSYNFDGMVNTTAQGHPVPLAYGELVVGSAVISAGMSTTEG